MADDMGEKTEAPTGRRLEESRSKGQVAKSTDLSGAIDLIGAAILLVIFGRELVDACGNLMKRFLLEHASVDPIEPAGIGVLLMNNTHGVLLAMAPLVGIMVLIAIAAQALQVGWLFTLYPIQPNLSKLDPIKGLGRVFGKRGVVKTGANSLKLVVMLIIAAIIIRKDLDEIAGLPRLNMAAAMAMIGEMIYQLVKWLLALLLLLGIVDYFVQKHQHTQDLKMTKQEVRDERRSMEGDPEIKGRRLRMAREIAMQRINSAVPQADVIVTNPTHFSVAIKYDSESMRAPVVVAKGADDLAFRIRDLARTHGVPVVERPPLARALYHGIDVGREIDPEHYQAVAEVLAYVYRLDSKVQAFEEAMV